jgi:hypothetical protein
MYFSIVRWRFTFRFGATTSGFALPDFDEPEDDML